MNSAIILAAGLSQRMGEINKLLLSVQGVPLIRHTVSTYLAAGIEQLVVVVGFQQEKIRQALAGLEVEIVFNPEFAEGQITSTRCGLKNVNKQSQYVLVGLGDQPLLTSDDIRYLLSQFDQQSLETMLVPYYKGQRGNPILLTTEQATQVDKDGIHLGCRKLIDKHPEKVFRLNVNHSRYHCDLDTPADVNKVLGVSIIEEVL